MVAPEYFSSACSASCASYSAVYGQEAYEGIPMKRAVPRRSESPGGGNSRTTPIGPCAITLIRSSFGKTTVTG